MTGSAESGERERCLEAGMDEFLTKPVDLGLLCDVVTRLTSGSAGSVPDTDATAAAEETRREGAERERAAAVPDDAPLLREIEAAEADICGLTLVTADVAEADGDDEPGPGAVMLSSADVVPLTGEPADDGRHDGPRPALDLERLGQSSMGIPALRASLLSAFLTEVRPRLEQLSEAVVVHDARRIEFEAHGLKGMCLTLGADVCGEVFAEMECLGREQRLDGMAPLLKRAHLEVTRTERYIATLERMAA
jgi:hypothetical protein